MNSLRARRVLSQLILLVGLVAWVGGQLAGHVHRMQVLHVACVEHGEQVELVADHAAHDHGVVDVASQGTPGDHHDHDCVFDAVGSAGLPGVAAVVPPVPLWFVAPVRGPPADHALDPPLTWAPKTSPPALG